MVAVVRDLRWRCHIHDNDGLSNIEQERKGVEPPYPKHREITGGSYFLSLARVIYTTLEFKIDLMRGVTTRTGQVTACCNSVRVGKGWDLRKARYVTPTIRPPHYLSGGLTLHFQVLIELPVATTSVGREILLSILLHKLPGCHQLIIGQLFLQPTFFSQSFPIALGR